MVVGIESLRVANNVPFALKAMMDTPIFGFASAGAAGAIGGHKGWVAMMYALSFEAETCSCQTEIPRSLMVDV